MKGLRMTNLRRLLSGERVTSRGNASMEFALVLPLLATMMFILLESGYLFYSYVTVQKAAHIGARFAVTGQGEQEGNRLQLIKEEALELTGNLRGSSDVYVRSWEGTNTTGEGREENPGRPCDVVEVEVQSQYEALIPLLEPILSGLTLDGVDRKVNEPWIPCEKDRQT